MSKRNRRWLFAGSGAALIGAALAFFGLSHANRGEAESTTAVATATKSVEPRAAAVEIAPVAIRSIQRTVEAVGSFEGFEEVPVTPKVDGRVVRILHDVGETVRPGDVLLEIDPTDYELALQEAKRGLESELAKVGLKEMPGPDFDLQKLPTVIRARDLEANAQRKLARTQKLYQSNASSQEEFDQVTTDYRVAQSAKRQVELDAEAILATAQLKLSQVRTAEQKLKDTRVEVPQPSLTVRQVAKSPEAIEYTISERKVAEGEMVMKSLVAANSSGVFRLVIDKALKMKAAVPERYIGQIKLGQTVRLGVEAYPDKSFEGKIIRIAPTVDRASRTFQIEVLVLNQSRELKPGGFAKASVLLHVDPHAKTVPQEATVTSSGVTKLYVVENGKVKVVPISTGATGRGWVEVIGDLDPQSQVVVSGQNAVSEGAAVAVRTSRSMPQDAEQETVHAASKENAAGSSSSK